MASALLQAFGEKRIDLYHDEDLLRDLRWLAISEKQWGYKLEPKRDSEGHGDRAIALAIALPAALDFAMTYSGQSSEPIFSTVYDEWGDVP